MNLCILLICRIRSLRCGPWFAPAIDGSCPRAQQKHSIAHTKLRCSKQQVHQLCLQKKRQLRTQEVLLQPLKLKLVCSATAGCTVDEGATTAAAASVAERSVQAIASATNETGRIVLRRDNSGVPGENRSTKFSAVLFRE